jgi:hypothetical protein
MQKEKSKKSISVFLSHYIITRIYIISFLFVWCWKLL